MPDGIKKAEEEIKALEAEKKKRLSVKLMKKPERLRKSSFVKKKELKS